VAFLENKAIIIIDVLNDFVTGKLEAKRAKHIIPNLKRLVEAARKSNAPVIYSNDTHYPQDVEVTRKWGKHAIKGTKGAEVIPELKPAKRITSWKRGPTAASTRQA
jgi:nicotinamidase-related amidase